LESAEYLASNTRAQIDNIAATDVETAHFAEGKKPSSSSLMTAIVVTCPTPMIDGPQEEFGDERDEAEEVPIEKEVVVEAETPKYSEEVEIIVDSPTEPPNDDVLVAPMPIEEMDEQDLPPPPPPVIIEEPADGGSGIVDFDVFPPPKPPTKMIDSLEDEDEKKLPEELNPDQLKKLEHIQESNA
jgi:hypothetical protein